MKVLLAGYNLDIETIKEAAALGVNPDNLTPETLSAAYARISRSPKSLDELRKIAKREVEAARRSNQNIIFKMGHHSVAEHAVFNFDIMGISRLAAEDVEHFRLCSFTEKSQRYVKLQDDFIIPDEIQKGDQKKLFIDIINAQNTGYQELFLALKAYIFEKNKALASDTKNHILLENLAKEDARYVISLATETQLGLTLNARNLELLLRRFASSKLRELQQLGSCLYKEVSKVAPSVILFTNANDHDQLSYKKIEDLFSNFLEREQGKAIEKYEDVNLVYHNPHGDTLTCAACLHTISKLPFSDCIKAISKTTKEQKKEVIKAFCQFMEFYDSPHREFEYPEFIFELAISASCFAQLKRHRMATITVQPYNPDLGVTIPESIKEAGKESLFLKIIEKTNDTYDQLAKQDPLVAQYILTNAHKRRLLIKVNAREFYHISRLREDSHAQWDIREIVSKMSAQALQAMPLTMMLIGGKDAYPKTFEAIFGHPPRVTPPNS